MAPYPLENTLVWNDFDIDAAPAIKKWDKTLHTNKHETNILIEKTSGFMLAS